MGDDGRHWDDSLEHGTFRDACCDALTGTGPRSDWPWNGDDCTLGIVPLALLALLVLALPSIALAGQASTTRPGQERPETRAFQYSPYEEATIRDAMARLGLDLAQAPEGKTVESIEMVRLEVVEDRDPAPRFLNVFHVVTKGNIVERESLLGIGDVYQQSLVDEMRRNLAALPQLSLVLVFAAEGSTPDRVRIVIVTKDVWSLRLDSTVTYTSSGLEKLQLRPSEINLFGTHQTLGLAFDWLPLSYSLGARYKLPRVLGSHATVSAGAGLVFHESGRREGSFGDLSVIQPVWSSRTDWAWGVAASWSDQVFRRYSKGEVLAFRLSQNTNCAESPTLCVPWSFSSEIRDAGFYLTRSMGRSTKHGVSVGFGANSARYVLPDLSAYDPATTQAFASGRLPASEDRVGPYVEYQLYVTSFLRVTDLSTLALQEDYRLGPQLVLRVQPMLGLLGSSRTYVAFTTSASYTVALADGMVRAGVDTKTEVQADDGQVRDGMYEVYLRIASPRWAPGRFVLDAGLLDRYANRRNVPTVLGGDTRLRGYPSQLFIARRSLLVVNAEFRSLPIRLLQSLMLAGALFYDAGDAFDRWHDLRVWQSAGLGLRWLFPQLNRTVFRMDLGFPISRPLPDGVSPVSYFFTFGQAF